MESSLSTSPKSPAANNYSKQEVAVSVHQPESIRMLFQDISSTVEDLTSKLNTMMKLKDRIQSDIQVEIDQLETVRKKLLSDGEDASGDKQGKYCCY
jgi:hypothetical protein